jgi:hypothetical protein
MRVAEASARAGKTGERMWRRRMQSLAREVLYAWAQDTAAALRLRELTARAWMRHDANMLGKAVHSWVLFTTDAIATRGLVEKRTREWWRLRRGAAFKAWRDETVERFYYAGGGGGGAGRGGPVSENGIAHAFVRRRLRTSLAGCFMLLRRDALDGKKRRATLTRVAARIANRHLATALASWSSTARVIRRARRIFEALLGRRSRRALSDVVWAWSDAAAHVRKRRRDGARAAARVVTRRQIRILKSALTSWDDVVARQCMQRRVVARSAARVGRRIFAAMMSRWKTLAKENSRCRKNAARVIARNTLRTEATALRGWRHASAERSRRRRQTLQKAAGRFTHRHQAACFARWTFAAAETRRLRSVASCALAKITSRVVGPCTLTPPDPQLKGAWYPGGFKPRTYQVRNRFQNVPFKCNLHRYSVVASAFRSWDESRFEAKRARAVLLRFTSKWQARDLSAAWSGWIAAIAEQRRIVRLTTRVANTLYTRVASQAFYTWLDRRAGAAKEYGLERKAAVFFKRRRARACGGEVL